MKKRFKNSLILTMTLLFVTVLPYSISKHSLTQAASTQAIQTNHGTSLHEAPTSHAEKKATIKNHTKEIIHAVTNRWASTEFQKGKGNLDVSTQTKKKLVANLATDTTIIGGLLPNVGQSYTYEPSFHGPEKKTYVATKNPYFDNAVNLLEDEYTGYTYIESPSSFALGVAYSDVFYFSLDYPMKAKATIRDTDYGIEKNDYTDVTVTSTTETVHTKAGTFKNVVVLTYPNGSTLFIAKDYGIIKITDYEGNTSTELIAVQD
ncbi:hypothetical protein CSE16_16010 [Solibacillus sp. R5-41]|uniref:hypothetical protein n=1 Tax=Solibacillus sp. R5-41 TaxID=2048654 RepID=UPI000C129728|nr:hypothetical protein [Solibacillus sp. R5-41]ATP41444.1 hypothetical protein CSE16_16010 [Solibacillus sp. R5-41]